MPNTRDCKKRKIQKEDGGWKSAGVSSGVGSGREWCRAVVVDGGGGSCSGCRRLKTALALAVLACKVRMQIGIRITPALRLHSDLDVWTWLQSGLWAMGSG